MSKLRLKVKYMYKSYGSFDVSLWYYLGWYKILASCIDTSLAVMIFYLLSTHLWASSNKLYFYTSSDPKLISIPCKLNFSFITFVINEVPQTSLIVVPTDSPKYLWSLLFSSHGTFYFPKMLVFFNKCLQFVTVLVSILWLVVCECKATVNVLVDPI